MHKLCVSPQKKPLIQVVFLERGDPHVFPEDFFSGRRTPQNPPRNAMNPLANTVGGLLRDQCRLSPGGAEACGCVGSGCWLHWCRMGYRTAALWCQRLVGNMGKVRLVKPDDETW